MAECTCANPRAVAEAINNSASTISGKIESAGQLIDETMYGKSMQGGAHGAPAPVRFCHWAAPEYGGVGESAWTNFFRAAQLAIALLNATIQGQIADKQQDLANGYYQQAKYKWDRFDKRYRPLEESILDETSSVPIREMDCDDDRDRASLAVGSAYDTIGAYMTRKARALRLCLDPTSVDQLEFGRNLLLVDTENYNLRDDTWFTDFKNDQRWNRRSNILNLGRNLGSMALKYGDVSRALMSDVGGIANKAAGSLSMALGYYGARLDTVYPTGYLGTGGQGGNIGLVGTNNTAVNAAAPGGGMAF